MNKSQYGLVFKEPHQRSDVWILFFLKVRSRRASFLVLAWLLTQRELLYISATCATCACLPYTIVGFMNPEGNALSPQLMKIPFFFSLMQNIFHQKCTHFKEHIDLSLTFVPSLLFVFLWLLAFIFKSPFRKKKCLDCSGWVPDTTRCSLIQPIPE